MNDQKYYAQFGEDKFIFENNLLPEKGFFLDIGAGDPKENSNTYFFEKRGWDGICIDADPKQIEKLRKERKNVIHTAIGSYDGKARIDFHRFSELSRISANGKDEVSVFKLSTIMQSQEIEKVDLLSIDVEGQEMEVLKGMQDMKKEFEPKVIIIEHISHVDGDKSEDLLNYFKHSNYELAHKTNSNLIFK
jgi:FkbM family methyltransferase